MDYRNLFLAFELFPALALFLAFAPVLAFTLVLAFEAFLAFELVFAFELLRGNGLPGFPVQLGSSSSALDGLARGSFAGATELRPEPDIALAPVCVPTKV